jgi:hypothetical protein
MIGLFQIHPFLLANDKLVHCFNIMPSIDCHPFFRVAFNDSAVVVELAVLPNRYFRLLHNGMIKFRFRVQSFLGFKHIHPPVKV